MKLHYILGDATKPIRKPVFITHVCNNIGGWGRGFVLALSKTYPEPEQAYRQRFGSGNPIKLGETQLVEVQPLVYVANMVAQKDIRWHRNEPPIRYNALEKCLSFVYASAKLERAIVQMPRIGAALAGGDWKIISGIIQNIMTVDTYVCTLPEHKNQWDEEYEAVQ